MCAKGVADLNRSKTGTACRTGHQQRFPGTKGCPLDEGMIGRAMGAKHRPRVIKIQSVRYRIGMTRWHRDSP